MNKHANNLLFINIFLLFCVCFCLMCLRLMHAFDNYYFCCSDFVLQSVSVFFLLCVCICCFCESFPCALWTERRVEENGQQQQKCSLIIRIFYLWSRHSDARSSRYWHHCQQHQQWGALAKTTTNIHNGKFSFNVWLLKQTLDSFWHNLLVFSFHSPWKILL